MNKSKFDFNEVKNDLLENNEGEITMEIDREEGIAIIWLNHVEKRNSITGKMMVDLLDCIERLEVWIEGKAVLLCGKGVNFSSGGDLDFVRLNANPNNASNMSEWMMRALQRLSKLEMVTVCVAHGATLGGGAEISTFCDYLLVGEDVKYGFIQGSLGITTAWGGGTKLIQKVGHRKAMDLLLTSKILTAEECVNLGLAEKVISSKNFLADSLTWLKQYIKHDHQVIRSFKRLVNTHEYGGVDRAFECERQMTKYLWGGKKHMEEINKFKKKSGNRKNHTDAAREGGTSKM